MLSFEHCFIYDFTFTSIYKQPNNGLKIKNTRWTHVHSKVKLQLYISLPKDSKLLKVMMQEGDEGLCFED